MVYSNVILKIVPIAGLYAEILLREGELGYLKKRGGGGGGAQLQAKSVGTLEDNV